MTAPLVPSSPTSSSRRNSSRKRDMAHVLVLVDIVNGRAAASTGELLAAAAGLGDPAAVVVAEPGAAAEVAQSLGALGAATVFVAEPANADSRLVTPQVAALQAATAA